MSYLRINSHLRNRAGVAASIALAALIAAATGCISAPRLSSGIDVAGMDKSVTPGDDFNSYANGGWIKATPIPADKASFGIFTVLADDTRKRLLALIQDSAKGGSATDGDVRKVGDFYSSFMDEAAIEAKGIAPLKPKLDGIAAIKDRKDLARVLGSELRADVDALNNTNFETANLFGVWITQGLADPSHSYPYLLQGGLGMPDRDYYLSTSPHMAELRKQYQAHVQAMLQLAGFDKPAERAARIFALETKMAGVHATRVESEDVHTVVSWKRDELAAKAPGLDWPSLLTAAGLNDAPVFYIWQPKPSPDCPSLPQRNHSIPGRTGLRSTRSRTLPHSFPRRLSTSASTSVAKLSAAFPSSARAGSAAWITPAEPWEKPSASSSRKNTFQPRRKQKYKRWSPI